MSLPNVAQKEPVVAYARFSSDGQREESIDGQLRAIRDYANKNNMRILHEYIDKAKSGTNDQRPEFQRLVTDSERKRFTKILVWKLDRFARNNLISLMYIDQFAKESIKVVSITEQFDDSPSGEFMRNIMLAQNQMFSRNLATDVERGKKENAYKGMHVGGIPPLGYDIDRETYKLVINETEAAAVRLIFSMYLAGEGYGKIIDKLNLLGYKTKRGNAFGKNSLHEILCNEKYTGTYVYNRTKKAIGEKYNRHKIKPDDEVIKTEDAHPAIISKEDFARVALRKLENRKNAPSNTAKEVYLLSGKIVCGECGSRFNGINRPARDRFPQYIGYRCSKKNGSIKCKNPEIRRESLELFVLDKLAHYLFSNEMSERLFQGYSSRHLCQVTEAKKELVRVQFEIEVLSNDIVKVVDLMIQTGSAAISERLAAMEDRKRELEAREEELSHCAKIVIYPKSTYTRAFQTAKKRLSEGKLEKTREIINQFVDVVTVYKDHITISFQFDGIQTPKLKTKIPRNLAQTGDSTVFLNPSINSQIDTMHGRGRRT